MKKLFVFFRNLLFVLLGAYIFYAVFKDIDLSKIWYDARHANYFWIILALTVVLSGHLARALRWRILVNALGYKITTGRSFMAVMINYAANVAIPRAGELSRPLVISRTDKVPFTKLVGTIIVERALDMVLLMLLTLLAFAIEFENIKETLYEQLHQANNPVAKYITLPNLILAGFAILAVVVLLFLIRKSKRSFKQHPLYIKIRSMVSGLWQGIKTLWKMNQKWLFIFYTLYIWFTYFMLNYLLFSSIDATSNLGMREALFILVVGSIGFIVPVSAGTGYYAAAVWGLSIYGVSEYDAKLFAFLGHTSQTLMIVFIGIVSYISFLIIQHRSRHDELSENTTEN